MLAGAGVAPLAVDAEALAAAVPAVVPLTSVNADAAAAALLALGAPPLVHICFGIAIIGSYTPSTFTAAMGLQCAV